MGASLKVAFVTGNHPYDVPALHDTFRSLHGIEVYPQSMEDWAYAGTSRTSYDVVVFYHMLMNTPGEKAKGYDGRVRTALEELGQSHQGIVVLHHALLAYPDWPLWSDLVGIPDRTFGYHMNQQLHVQVATQDHPITRGLSDWDMPDETYTMADARPEDGNQVLLAVDHPLSTKTIAWVRQLGQARVFCFQSGHDGLTYIHPRFREVLGRGVRWAAASSCPATLPVTMPAIWFAEKGKTVIRQDPTPVCWSGHILCQTLYSGLTNGTERNILMGGNYGGRYPSRCGYQNVGRVIEVGVGVQDYAVGDLVFSGDFSQHQQFFALEVRSPERLVIKLPADADLKQAALFGMASVGMHDVRRAGVELGDKVLVVGAGCIGQFTAQAARAAGAIVTVADLDTRRLEIARSCGAHQTVPLQPESPWDDVKKLGPFDVVFEDSGAAVLDSILGLGWGQTVLKHRGKVILIAGRGRVDYSFNAGQSAELDVQHAGHFIRDDLVQVARLVADGVIHVRPLIQDVVPANDVVSRVYDRLRDEPNSLLGTVIDWTGASAAGVAGTPRSPK